MAGVAEADLTVVGQTGTDRLHLIRETGFGEDQVQLDENAVIGGNGIGKIPDLGRERCEDPFNFGAFTAFEHLELIVGLDRAHRFDEDRRT